MFEPDQGVQDCENQWYHRDETSKFLEPVVDRVDLASRVVDVRFDIDQDAVDHIWVLVVPQLLLVD